ncbi:MAG TPA: FAD-dependent oxidoreductase, partial [Gammaproteobacteria bacterium]|nr:FAD-dependent oxidoreductase [Gammaproteobacteria bacterium]
MNLKAEVAIVGGGIAGLAAARVLARAGRSSVVCEARGRLGGRIYTLRPAGLTAPVELGAEFVHGRPQGLVESLRAAGIQEASNSEERDDFEDMAAT